MDMDINDIRDRENIRMELINNLKFLQEEDPGFVLSKINPENYLPQDDININTRLIIWLKNGSHLLIQRHSIQ